MDFTNFSGRDGIILAVILIAVYLLVSLLRLTQLKRKRTGATRRSKAATGASAEAGAAEQDAAPAPDAAAEAPPLARPYAAPSFEDQLFRTNVEAELQQLREEVAELRTALAQLKASRRVSPQYNEAMLLAQRGVGAQSIADQCAISIGEAELVLALSRNRQEYEDYDRQDDGRE